MAFDMGGGQMGLSFGFDFDAASVSSVERAITDVASMTDRLALSEANLGRTVSSTQQQWMSATQTMQQYSQSLQQTTQEQQQFQQASQQSVSILSGAGTSAGNAARQYTSFNDALGGMQRNLATANRDIDQHNALQENLAGTTQTSFEKIQQLGQGFGLAASSITGLVFSSYSLQRAQFTLHRTETQLELARNRLGDQTIKLAKATDKYGASSQEVAQIQADMALQQQKINNLQERAGLVQENYDHQLLAFATTTGPLVISTFSSVTQGITSMSEILKVSRADVVSFIGAWGPWIGVGAAVVAMAIDVANGMAQIQKADEDLKRHIAAGDWAATLQDRLNKLRGVTEHPGMIIAQSLETLTGKFGAKSGFDVLGDEQKQADFINTIIGLREKIGNEMKSPEWDQVFRFPQSAFTGLNTDVQHLKDLLDPRNFDVNVGIAQTGQFQQAYAKRWLDMIDAVYQTVKQKVAQAQQDFANALSTGGVADVAKFILPDEATAQQNIAAYKQDLFVAQTAFIDFRARQKDNYRLGVEEYIMEYGQGLSKAQQDMLKGMATTSDQAVAIQNKQTTAEVMAMNERVTAYKLALEAEQQAIQQRQQDADKLMQQRKLEALEVQHQEDIIFQATGKRLKLNTIDVEMGNRLFEISKQKVEGYKNEELALAELASKHNILNAEIVDLVINEQDDVTTLNNLIAANIDYLRAITDVTYQKKLLSEGFRDGAIHAEEFLASVVKNEAEATAYGARLEVIAKLLGANLPQGIELTNTQLENAIKEFVHFGDTARTTTDILNSTFSETRGFVGDLIKQFAEGGKAMRDAWKDVPKEFIPKGLQDNVKNFLKDQADIVQAGEKMKASLGLFQSMLDFGQLSGKQITGWTKELKDGMSGINSELDDLVGHDIRKLITGPLMDLFHNGLTQDEVNKLNAWVNEYVRLSSDKDGLTPQDIQVLKDLSDTLTSVNNAAGDNAENIDSWVAKMTKVSDWAEEHGKKLVSAGGGLVTLANKKGKVPKTTGKIGDVLQSVLDIVPPEDQQKPDNTVKDIDKMSKDIATSMQKVQTAGKNMAEQVSNSMSIMVNNMKPHVTTIMTYFNKTVPVAFQTSQTAAANFANQGSNSVSLFVQNIRPHVITIQTYFAKTIAGAINQASMQLIAFAALAKQIGAGGTGGGGGGFQNVQFFANPGVSGAIGAGVGFASDSLTRFLQSLGIKMPGGMDQGLIQNPFRKDDKSNKGGGGGGGSDAVNAMKAVEVEAQKLQTGLANLANQGSNSMSILAKSSSTNMNGMKKNLLVGEVAAQALQTGVANLANEGANSLTILAKSSSTNMNGFKKNLSVGEVAAQKLQTGIANLDNEGVKSLKELAHWSSTTMNGFKNNMAVGVKAVNSLKDAINSLKSKTVTVKVVVSQSEGGVWHMAKGGLLNISSAQNGEIIETNGPTMIPIVAGDNPGGHEIAAFIPMNNPVPTLKRLSKVFGARQSSIGSGSTGGSGPSDSGEGGVEVINLYMNEEKMMTWIRRKLLRNKQGA